MGELISGPIENPFAEGGDIGQHVSLLRPMSEFRRGRARKAALTRFRFEDNDAVCGRKWRLFEEHGIDEGEDGRVGADAQAQAATAAKVKARPYLNNRKEWRKSRRRFAMNWTLMCGRSIAAGGPRESV